VIGLASVYNNGMVDKHATAGPTRFAPELTFPVYSYVPGRFPHPLRDPRGHSFGHAPLEPPAPTSDNWRASQPFCFAVDLFNHGYYWESHEVWESLWKACGRRGVAADFLKSLIKLAAAGVKAREGRREGWQRHLRRARELLDQTIDRLGAGKPDYFGLSLTQLIAAIDEAISNGPPADASVDAAVRTVFALSLSPS
jgi:predicted metal-dependent hydrolase